MTTLKVRIKRLEQEARTQEDGQGGGWRRLLGTLTDAELLAVRAWAEYQEGKRGEVDAETKALVDQALARMHEEATPQERALLWGE